MRRTYLLGVGAALVIAACTASKDSLLNPGTAGSAHGGAAGTATGGKGGTAGGGTGGRNCDEISCLRPYECVRSCGGPIEYSGCCTCEPPLFDNFMNMACGGGGGSSGTTGSGATGGTTGSGGTIASGGTTGVGGTTGAGGTGGRPAGVFCTYPESARCLGQCGDGVRDSCHYDLGLGIDCSNSFTEWCDGADLGTATCASRGLGSGTLRCKSDCGFDTSGCSGAPGGSGGTSGTTGTGGAGGTTGGGGTGGARLCETAQCIRPYVCKASCGGPVVSNNCCACEPPLFDDFNGQVCGDGGAGSVTYLGCTYVGGSDRVVVSKRDTARNLCFNVVLYDSPGTPTAGLTSPQNFRLEWASAGPASACPSRFPQSASATQTIGTITQTAGGLGVPQTVDIDVTMSFGAGNDAGAPAAELLSAQGVDVRAACQQ